MQPKIQTVLRGARTDVFTNMLEFSEKLADFDGSYLRNHERARLDLSNAPKIIFELRELTEIQPAMIGKLLLLRCSQYCSDFEKTICTALALDMRGCGQHSKVSSIFQTARGQFQTAPGQHHVGLFSAVQRLLGVECCFCTHCRALNT